MCGIAGIVASGLSPDKQRERLLAMRDRLRHRGPDDQGAFFHPEAGTALAHTRLAILDLSDGGHQPMTSRDGRYIIVFNGEIYNFRELRAELELAGETFRTQSDTEVLLRLYARDGESCVHKLDGMFAFAIWDRDEQSCFLARDPLGIKPLYFWRQGETLAFASEMRALLAAELGPKRICASALYEYLLYGSVQDPLTLVEQVQALPAGHTLLWQRGVCQPKQYWQLQFGSETMDEREAVQLTREALEDSIRRHFVSDVPVGIFLSGGLDSTAIVALAKSCGFDRLQTLCISFDDPAYDEGSAAAETAKHFGTEHHDWQMTADEGRRLLAEFLNHIDRPSNDGFNTFCVAKFAQEQGLKVVLSGVGGDELFGSYSSFQMIPTLMAWHRRLEVVKPLRGVAGRIGERVVKQQKYRRLSTFLRTPGRIGDAYWTVRGFFSPCEAEQLMELFLGNEFDAEALDMPEVHSPEQPTLADEISYMEITRYMRNQLLRDSDVMSMAWGLELRTPLVDRKLIDRVGRVSAKQRLTAGKRLLVEAVTDIPASVAVRPKRGFRFPFAQWVRAEWRDLFLDVERLAGTQCNVWYRNWCLFMLMHFLRNNGFSCPIYEDRRSNRLNKSRRQTNTVMHLN
jgi:asparagine synthase (glutamine-hydrolysing)